MSNIPTPSSSHRRILRKRMEPGFCDFKKRTVAAVLSIMLSGFGLPARPDVAVSLNIKHRAPLLSVMTYCTGSFEKLSPRYRKMARGIIIGEHPCSGYSSQEDIEKVLPWTFSIMEQENAIFQFLLFQWLAAIENGGISLCRAQAVEKPSYSTVCL